MRSKRRARIMLENVVFYLCLAMFLGAIWYYIGVLIFNYLGLR